MWSRVRRPLTAGLASAVLARGVQCSLEAKPRDAPKAPPSASLLDKLSFRGTYRGQLSPPLPQAGASTTSTGAVLCDAFGISWQRGAYDSWWLRLGAAAPLPDTTKSNV